MLRRKINHLDQHRTDTDVRISRQGLNSYIIIFHMFKKLEEKIHTLSRDASESENCSVVSNSLQSHGLQCAWNSPGQNIGVGSLSLLQGIFPTQGSNPGLPHCRWILYQLSHKGSPRILAWVAYPFSSGSSQPRKSNQGLLHFRRILYQLNYERSK